MARVRRRRLKINTGLQFGGSGAQGALTADINRQWKQIEDKILSIFNQLEDASEDIMLAALEPTFEKARDVYCPHFTGELRASGYLEVASFRGKPRVEMGFGKGGKPDYTVHVHELPEPYHEPPTRWKFLQAAMMEDLDEIYSRLGVEYKAFMGI